MHIFQIVSSIFFKVAPKGLVLVAALVVTLLISGCAEAGQMQLSARFDPLSETTLFADGRSARQPVPNTVPYSTDSFRQQPAQHWPGVIMASPSRGSPFRSIKRSSPRARRVTIFTVSPVTVPAVRGTAM